MKQKPENRHVLVVARVGEVDFRFVTITPSLVVSAIAVILWWWLVAGSIHGADESTSSSMKNSVGMDFVRVSRGEYRRGFETDDRGEQRFHLAHQFSNRQDFKNERPAHRVAITMSFDLAKCEVTVAQFGLFTSAIRYVTDAEKSGGGFGCFPEEENYVDRFHRDPRITWQSPGFPQSDDHPVVVVSWNDAQAFCRWLSEKENATYRLPTEAEWEYACRAGTTAWYSWGEDPDAAYHHANVADGALEAAQPNTTRFQRAVKLGATDGDGIVFTSKARSFKPNPWGLYDMHGNVWEWCQDRWSEDVYERFFDDVPRSQREQLVVPDPLFEKETDQHKYGDWRVMRGGAWTCAPAAVRCSIRTFAEAADASVYTGFRVVRDVPRSTNDFSARFYESTSK